MTALLLTFVILHIITAAAWFGLGLRLSAQARAALNTAGGAARALADDVQRSVRLMSIFIVLTLVFAVGAFIAGGAFDTYGPAYHTSLLLIVVLVGLQFFVIRTGWKRLYRALDGERADADQARKQVSIGVGIGHLIWLVLLILMFWEEWQLAFS